MTFVRVRIAGNRVPPGRTISSTNRRRFRSASEQALDVDAVSAAAPDAKIVVVQAKSASFADLGTAVGHRLQAALRSRHLEQLRRQLPGVVGQCHGSRRHLACFSRQQPRLVRDGLEWRRVGLLDVNNALTAAATFDTGCAKRAIADVSAAADPGKGGLAIYYPTTKTSSTWAQFGGTSESAPIIATVYALSGNTAG